MGDWIVHNGVFHVDGTDKFFHNRAFALGDGFFETIRVMNGRVLNWTAHYQRIVMAAEALHLEFDETHTESTLLELAIKLIANENIVCGGRIRITMYRSGGGTYRPINDLASYLMHVEHYPIDSFEIHPHGLILGDFHELKKDFSKLSAFKLLGSQVYIQAARACKLPFDDLLIYNSFGRLVEATSSNVFIVKEGILYTPPLSEGGIAGVMRMLVINTALTAGIPVFEKQMTSIELEMADEIFICNVMKGCTWVKGYSNKRYTHAISDRLIRLINMQYVAEGVNSI